MTQFQTTIVVATDGSGLVELTAEVRDAIRDSGIQEGLCTLFVQHTSASLTVQENANPTARADLESFLDRLVPEGDSHYRHTAEGPDDMPAHIKAALTLTSLGVPVSSGRPRLGTWQGIYLWEHRRRAHRREVAVQIMGE